jgi:hypothetical protein
VAAVALGATLVLGLVTVASWPALERRYHLERLRREPALLEGMLLASGQPRRAAAAGFIREPVGRRELFRLYLLELDRTSSGMGVRDILLRERSDSARRGLLALRQDGISHQSWTVTARSHASFSLANAPQDPARRQRLLELLPALAGEVFSAPGFEGLEFQLHTAEGGSLPPPAWPGVPPGSEWLPWTTPTLPPGAHHACFYRVVGVK